MNTFYNYEIQNLLSWSNDLNGSQKLTSCYIIFDWHVNHRSMFLPDKLTIPFIICSFYYHCLKFIGLLLKLCKLLKTYYSNKFLTLVSIYSINEHVGSVKWDNRANKNTCGKINAGKILTWTTTKQHGLPSMHPSSFPADWKAGVGRPFGPVARIEINHVCLQDVL